MTFSLSPETPVDPSQARRGTRYIVSHYCMTNLGYFSLLSTLVVTLNAAGFSTARIAMLIMLFTITTKVAKIPLAPWLDRLPVALSVLIGCCGAAAGFIILALADGLVATAIALALAGTGISINALASKQLAASVSDMFQSRARLFSAINIGINVASAVAAPLALVLAASKYQRLLPLFIALIYACAGLMTWLNFSRLKLRRTSTSVASLRAYLNMLRRPGLPSFLAVNFFGWLMYGQLFNVLALHVSQTLGSAERLGWLYTFNALLVIGLQMAVTAWASRLSRGKQMSSVLMSYAGFTVAFLLPMFVPGYFGAIAFVLVFTVAEMMFVPSVDVLLLDLIGTESRAVGYSVLSISTALGESVGGAVGVMGYRWMSSHGVGQQFWLALAIVSLICIGITWLLQKISQPLRELPAHA